MDSYKIEGGGEGCVIKKGNETENLQWLSNLDNNINQI